MSLSTIYRVRYGTEIILSILIVYTLLSAIIETNVSPMNTLITIGILSSSILFIENTLNLLTFLKDDTMNCSISEKLNVITFRSIMSAVIPFIFFILLSFTYLFVR